MSSEPTERPMAQRLRSLRRAYAQQLPHRIAQIESASRALPEIGWRDALRSLRLMAHSLAGSGAIFGYDRLSEKARNLVSMLAQIEATEEEQDLDRDRLMAEVAELREACFDAEDHDGTGEIEAAAMTNDDRDVLPFEPTKSRRLLFLVTRNSSLAADLSFQLGCFGYLVRAFADAREPLERLDESPAVLIVDADPFAPVVAETREFVDELRRRNLSMPVVLISVRSDLQTRLEAVRAGVDVFLTSPPSIRKLVERLEVLTHSQPSDPFRVLVVQQSYQDALRHSLVLQRSGMTAAIATQPDRALKELVDFQPDVVLLNVDLPEVTGPELAAIIRQSDAYIHVPIVFLSEGAPVDVQLGIMRSGADDLVDDPEDLESLVSTVSYHAQRSRSLRYFLSHDSLTGVLNHTEFMQRLEAEFEQSARHQRSFSYAIIDLDNLRSINERYGYLTGDGVIKSLAGLLTQRLRKTDLVGRWGGEEFGVIMPDTPGKGALRVLDEIRALFSELPHRSSEGTFHASFTAGIAALPGYDLAVELHEDARRSLTVASRQGRNRVVLVND